MSTGGPGVEVASGARQETAEQEQEATAEPGAAKTKFSSAGVKPPVAPKTETATPSASDQAFGDDETSQGGDPRVRFRAALAKRDPAAITLAGQAPAVIGALIVKDPALAAKYFDLVAANRSDSYREPLAALFPHLTLASKKRLFAAQFGFEIVEQPQGNGDLKTGEFQPDQIDKMYEAAQLLPPAHMIGNPRFKKLEAGMGATFHDKQDTIEMPSYAHASTGKMEKAYSSAFCHEVGHAVDFALGQKTDELRRDFGWNVIKQNNDDANVATHFEELGMLARGLEAKERLALADAMSNAVSGGDDYMTLHLTHFRGLDKAQAADPISRGVTPLWKERRGAFSAEGITVGDQQYFACSYGNGGWGYKVNKSTFDAAPPKGKVSHYEWFAEWYAAYYTTPDHAGVPDGMREFFRDEVDTFNQQRSPLGTPDATEGTGGTTPRHM